MRKLNDDVLLTQSTEELERIAETLIPIASDPRKLAETQQRNRLLYSTYTQLRHDYRREEMYRAVTLLCVDFSEIFPYIHPLEDPATGHGVSPQDALLAKLVFDQSVIPMLLPPAALSEFLDHLAFLARRIRIANREVPRDLLRFQQSGIAHRARRAIGKAEHSQGEIRAVVEEVAERWPRLIELEDVALDPRTAETFMRIRKITQRMAPTYNIVPSEYIEIDHDAYRQAFDFLTSKRPLRAQHNHRDAVNFAFAYHIDRESFRKPSSDEQRQYAVLWTRGFSLSSMGGLAFPFDPIKDESALVSPGIVRDTEYAIVRTILDGFDSPLRHEIVTGHIQMAELTAEILERIERGAQRKKGSGLNRGFIGELSRRVGASLLEHQSYLANEGEVSARFHRAVAAVGLGPALPLRNPEGAEEDGGTKTLRRLLSAAPEEVEERTETYRLELERASTWLEDQFDHLAGQSSAYPVSSGQRYTRFAIVPLDAKRRRYAVTPEAGRPASSASLLAVIVVKSEAYSVSCRHLPGQLPWFCRLAKYLIARAAAHETMMPVRRVNKLFDGVELLSARTGQLVEMGQLTDDLAILDDPDQLWFDCISRTQEIPGFVRVNTPYMDLWYNFLSQDTSRGRVGLISHLPLADVVAYFIARCQDQIILENPLESALDGFLSPRYTMYEKEEELEDYV